MGWIIWLPSPPSQPKPLHLPTKNKRLNLFFEKSRLLINNVESWPFPAPNGDYIEHKFMSHAFKACFSKPPPPAAPATGGGVNQEGKKMVFDNVKTPIIKRKIYFSICTPKYFWIFWKSWSLIFEEELFAKACSKRQFCSRIIVEVKYQLAMIIYAIKV